MSKKGETSNKTFQYFMVGGMGLLAAAGAKATVQGEPSRYECRGCLKVSWDVSEKFEDAMAENGAGTQIS